MKRRALLVVLLGAAAAGLYVRCSSDERAVESTVRKLVDGARVSRAESRPARNVRLEQLLADTTSPRLRVQSVNLPAAPPGRDALIAWATLLEVADDAALDLVDPRTVVEGSRASVHSDLVFKAHAGGDEWTDRRAVAFQLEKGRDGWRVSVVDIGARPNNLPEARP